jgi:hypothetical protein
MKLRNLVASLGVLALFAACGDDPSSKAPNGESCKVDSDCDSGLCTLELSGCHPFFGCSTYVLPGGMCSTECTWFEEGSYEEKLQSDCLDGEQCLAYADSQSVCFQGCEVDTDCREDYICQNFSDFSTCTPPEE